MPIIQDRRTFLAGLTAAGGAGLFGASTPAWAEPPPETAAARFVDFRGAGCIAPQYIAEGLLQGEGFTTSATYP